MLYAQSTSMVILGRIEDRLKKTKKKEKREKGVR